MKKLALFNTLTRQKEEFRPIKSKKVSLYTCGPTVYDFAHVGNLRTYVFEDILKRSLLYLGYKVKHIQNITDVGHLVSDEDAGEDKMVKALKRENLEPSVKSLLTLAAKYTKAFQNDLEQLNILFPNKFTPATKEIKPMIAVIKKIIKNGFAYETDEAIYFDTSKLTDYGKLSGQKLSEKEVGVREEVNIDPQKKHPADFVLWFKLAGKKKSHVMHWPSPWGEGFPGWHIECSAMSMKYLGKQFDIHCGGIDHIPVHHTNEIAQNEAASGTAAARFWMHGEFLTIDQGRMGKSAGNFITLQAIIDRGIDPLAYRYLLLQTHYRQRLNFSWESLEAAHAGYVNLKNKILELKTKAGKKRGKKIASFLDQFAECIADDLNVPKSMALLADVLKSNASPADVLATVYALDEVLGLNLKKIKAEKIPEHIQQLAQRRWDAKQRKEWSAADALRHQIETAGFIVEDHAHGFILKKK